MKKFLIILNILLCMMLTTQGVLAQDYSKISNNAKITSALNSLESINRRDVIAILKGNNATKRPIRVMFRDLAIFGYEDTEAITARTKSGGLVIYISAEHRGASPECIACLLAHESQHHTFTNTKAEELRAWISETQAWNEFVKRNSQLAKLEEPLAKREMIIAKIRDKGGVAGVQRLIATNPVYAGLN